MLRSSLQHNKYVLSKIPVDAREVHCQIVGRGPVGNFQIRRGTPVNVRLDVRRIANQRPLIPPIVTDYRINVWHA